MFRGLMLPCAFLALFTFVPMSALAAEDPAPAAPSTKAPQDPEQAAKEKDIRHLLELTGSAKLSAQIMGQMMTNFRRTMPNVPPEFWDECAKQINTDDLIELIIPIYSKHFTDDDIKGLIKFYESPLGRKLAAEMSPIAKESMEVGQKWGFELGQRVARQLQAKGYTKGA